MAGFRSPETTMIMTVLKQITIKIDDTREEIKKLRECVDTLRDTPVNVVVNLPSEDGSEEGETTDEGEEEEEGEGGGVMMHHAETQTGLTDEEEMNMWLLNNIYNDDPGPSR